MEQFQYIETDLVVRLSHGDEAAFAAVYELYSRRIYYFAYRFLKNKEQSEEIVSESFLNLWVNREKLDASYPIGPYLYTMARRQTLNVLRSIATSKAAQEKLWLWFNEAHNETEEAILVADLERFSEESIIKLPQQQQQVFRLSRRDGLSYDEIAERLDISRNTVKNHLVRAVKTLRVQLSRSHLSIFLLIAFLLQKK
ncbi:RNA polymerase sigma-70 factor [Mucilaginibacter mali]|uniref:RNA polymerase sigma-70 factor n=1 Tax=Mucilaginibacter mali TaxID=2740462 RepID=A0A7D4PUU6_9SPHI|nr:RNA polymerase sigma-70 factor [Mucilaginibacter mali]QKJ31048.1 RNA polymerase sigma-70 factor [Mucilaginibacter mali]